MNRVRRTDGKRSVEISDDRHGDIYISTCRNGWQTTTTTADNDMLKWLGDAIAEYLLTQQDNNDE
jgi:hypothetical protein